MVDPTRLVVIYATTGMIANMITTAVMSVPAIAVRSRIGMKKAPAVRIYHHRGVKCSHSAVFRIGGFKFIKLLSQLSQIPQFCLLIEKPINTKANRKQANDAEHSRHGSCGIGNYIHGRSRFFACPLTCLFVFGLTNWPELWLCVKGLPG